MRAHQCVMEGYEYFAKGHLITIFSATNYCGIQRNNGAILHVTDRKDHWLITPKYIECDVTANTWVNLPKQLPPSPMRVSKRTEISAAVSAFDPNSSPFLFTDKSRSFSNPVLNNNPTNQLHSSGLGSNSAYSWQREATFSPPTLGNPPLSFPSHTPVKNRK